MEFGVLGPVELRMRGRVVDAGHARQQCVLAVLLLNLGRVVPTGDLIDRVWGEEPPASVRNVLYTYIGRLRALIAASGDPEVTLARRQGAYLLQARPDQLDLGRFRRLAAEAASGSDEDRAAALRAALALWRGPAFAGLSSQWLDSMRQTLEVERLAATLDLNDIALRRGEHGTLVSELAVQAAAHSSDERLIGQLMLAQYRCGRQAEALATYQNARQMLADTLGADPGTGLRDIHQRILTADPSLDLPRPSFASFPGNNAPTAADQPAGPPRRDPTVHTREGPRPPRSVRLRATWRTVAATGFAVAAIAALLTNSVADSAHAPSLAAQAAGPSAQGARPVPGPASTINWQCGPFARAKVHHGSLIGQTLQACIASDHSHVALEGFLLGSNDAWKERIILVLRHPGQLAYKRLISPMCTESTCIYKVTMDDPGPGSWQVLPQWSSDGGYQSTGKSSPSITYRPSVPR
jgi:DNA-binding SARP family transcriptional activator